jgi:hypothetical protein
MISSEDILFLQGSTQFSDPYSYDVIGVMAAVVRLRSGPPEKRSLIGRLLRYLSDEAV